MIPGNITSGDGAEAGIRYWQPHEALGGLVSGYHCYWVRPAAGQRHSDVFYPGWANLRFQLEGDDWLVRIGGRCFDPVPRASLFGPTAHAIYTESGRGVLVGAGLTPLGWSRLTDTAAASVADRIAPLETIIGDEAGRLRAALTQVDGDGVKRVFDTWFLEHLRGPRRDDTRIVALHGLLTESELGGVAEAAARIGVHPRHFSRLVQRSFGFTPKLLLRRARFLRTLMALRDHPRGEWATLIGYEYHDQSHFIRDSHEFLGMAAASSTSRNRSTTPRRCCAAKSSAPRRRRCIGRRGTTPAADFGLSERARYIRLRKVVTGFSPADQIGELRLGVGHGHLRRTMLLWSNYIVQVGAAAM